MREAPTGNSDWVVETGLVEGVLLRRVFAFAIDGVLVSILGAVAWVVLFGFGLMTLGLGLPLLALIPAVPFVYNWLSLLTGASATPGQALMGLRVRRDDDLGPPEPLQALIWSAGLAVTIALGFVWFAVALVTVRHRALHDLVSGLVVVRARALHLLTRPRGAWKTGAGGPAFE